MEKRGSINGEEGLNDWRRGAQRLEKRGSMNGEEGLNEWRREAHRGYAEGELDIDGGEVVR